MPDDVNLREPHAIGLLLCALGGEGGGVLSGWLVEAAHRAGYAAQKTSIPGVAQRTGATTYYVEVFPVPLARLGGRRPVLSLVPVPGMVDVLVSSELLETARQVGLGMADAKATTILSSSHRALTNLERMQPGDGRFGAQRLVDTLRTNCRVLHLLDMAAVARRCETAVSAVMLGAIAASRCLPIPVAVFEQVLDDGRPGAAASLRGFRESLALVVAVGPAGACATRAADADTAPGLAADLARRFPAPVHAMLALGHARVLAYQDAHYAALYIERLERVLHAEQAIDPRGACGYATTRETARWLALWMCFDDLVRVAGLKLRAARRARIRSESRAGQGDVVKVYDHFKPGVPELAGLLPPRMAEWLERREAARAMRGHAALAFPLVLGAHTIGGALLLRALSSLRWLRRRGRRYAQEQALIERWLAAVAALTTVYWPAGHEAALCGRLVKGYGGTYDRSRRHLEHILQHLAAPGRFATPEQQEQALRAAREASLLDGAEKSFDEALRAHGAPPAPVPAVAIRIFRRPGAAAP